MRDDPPRPRNAGAPYQAARLAALRAAIEAETAAVGTAIVALKREQAELIGPQPERLPAILEEKQAAVRGVESARNERRRVMSELGLPRDPIAAEMRLAAHKTVRDAWDRLRLATREASILNALNARVAAQKLQYVSARLDALRQASNAQRTYDANGRRDVPAAGRVIASV